MSILQNKIQTAAKHFSAPQYVIEKDYALSYLLAGIALTDELKNELVFKGGTALKKIYFGDYRFSEDLDFSSKKHFTKNELITALNNSMGIAQDLLSNYGPFDIEFDRNPEKNPHPRGQEAFVANVKFPWHPRPMCRIKIEVTKDEVLVMDAVAKPILHGYDEVIDCHVPTYQITEIVAEKLRALLQTHDKLVTRGWTRARPRDYYDLWRILKDHQSEIDQKKLEQALQKKCQLREVSYDSIDSFFTDELVTDAKKNWHGSLAALMSDLPNVDALLAETKVLISNILL